MSHPHPNRLLNSLTEAQYGRIRSELEPVDLEMREVAFEADVPITHVYFIEQGVISIVADQEGGRIEVATVGSEGMVGLPVFLGTESVPLTAFAQVPGHALRLPAGALRKALAAPGNGLHGVLNRYTQALFYQIAQSSACRSAHKAEQRAARWLLMTHDRVAGDQFPLTQEFLAQMLGVRRATVTEIQGSLKGQGLIEYRRGEVVVLDRPGLERLACECYGLIAAEYERLLPKNGAA